MGKIAGCSALLLAICLDAGVARAQSALDGFDPGANNTVRALLVQPDGKILVGGDFTMLGGGGTGTTVRNHIGRLNADGSLDLSFNPGVNSAGTVASLALQPDGKILVGGNFTGLGGVTGTTTRNNIGRLNADGSVDAAFNPGTAGFTGVYAMIVQPNAKILVSGVFTGIGGGTGTTPRSSLARLNADGSVDGAFNPGVAGHPQGHFVAQIYAMTLQADGKIVVGGRFTGLGGGTGATPRDNIGRLNADGSVDAGFNPGTNSFVSAMALQADGKILLGGTFYMLGGGATGTTPRNGIGRLNADGTIDAGFNPGTDNDAIWSALAIQPDGKILLGGAFNGMGGGTGTTPRSHLGRINADGSLDLAFNPGANGSFNDYVNAFAVQPDGKIVVGGRFTGLGGGTGTTTRNYIGRLYADGAVETAFNPGAAPSAVYALAVQADQKIVVGGAFTGLGGGAGTTPRSRIGRLNADGSLDVSFDPGANGFVNAIAVQPDGKIVVGGGFNIIGGAENFYFARLNADGSPDASVSVWMNAAVYAVAVQPDGKILIAGEFSTMYDGDAVLLTRNRIARINADGSFDTSFDPGVAGTIVFTLALQPDGKILVGGGTGTTARNNIGRLNADGSVDTSFNPGADSYVETMVVQADGKIVVGGAFHGLGGGTGTITRNYIGRLNTDGSVDAAFDPGANSDVFALALQADGKILVGGDFTALGGGGTGTTGRNSIGRISPAGTIDLAFDPGANNAVLGMALQGDGKILFGGYFTTLGGGGVGTATRSGIGRVTNPNAALQSLSLGAAGTIMTWARGGASPDPARVTLEASADTTTYTPLGNGTRVAGGWQLSALTLPTNRNVFVRARGYYGSGGFNASGSIVESIRNVYVASLVTTITPSTGPIGGGTVVTITGTNFRAGATVAIGGVAATGVTVVNATTITATTGAHVAGTFLVAVTNAGGGPGILSNGFTHGTGPLRPVLGDFDADRAADLALYRPGNGDWMFLTSSSGFTTGPTLPFGVSTDKPVPGDYDGDGRLDTALYRPSNGTWYVIFSSTGALAQLPWGLSTDIPMQADYTGDGRTDLCVWRPSNGVWYIFDLSTGTYTARQWGVSTDTPLTGDYDGDGLADVAVFRPSTGVWYVFFSSTQTYISYQWGISTDIPLPADYSGDGLADLAVYRPSTGVWYVYDLRTTSYVPYQWGVSTDIPVPKDYDGDGRTDLAIWKPSTGTWFIYFLGTNTYTSVAQGATGDVPIK